MKMSHNKVNLSVRELVEFALRQGSINASVMSSNRALLGTLAHKKVQASMNEHYEKEVRLIHEELAGEITFIIEGRADGIIRDLVGVTVDEIKSTYAKLSSIDEDYNPLHWAQAKCYAYFFALQNGLLEIGVRLTYYQLETKEIKHLTKSYTFGELEVFFKDLITRYAKWIKFYMDWCIRRDATLKQLVFPFERYRKGQRELAVSVYKSIEAGNNLYVNAPTGIGKTISTLFPTLKAMGEGHVTKIFYLTAKTITRAVAEQAVYQLQTQQIALKTITLTAKDKICLCSERICTPDYCMYADGHFDRVEEALYDALTNQDVFTRDVVTAYAKKHKVCPFEFALDLAIYVDVVICDYNYVFDPQVALKRFLDSESYVLLVDEAHNLVDRAREMYSAKISKRQFLSAKSSLGKGYPKVREALNKLNQYLVEVKHQYIERAEVYISKEAPKELYTKLRQVVQSVDFYLQQGQGSTLPADMIEAYFEAYQFGRIYELFDEQYITYGYEKGSEVVIKMFCIDPSVILKKIIDTYRGSIFFSATLLPIDYYKEMLGGVETLAIALPSPFDNERSKRLVGVDVSTRYKHRKMSYSQIIQYIHRVTVGKVGNYMIFFPSYEYMMTVHEQFTENYPQISVVLQQNEMKEEEREAFLEKFEENPQRTIVGFCVLGGIFSEGIDLKHDRLIGVMIVGVGLPKIGEERDLIKHYFDNKGKDGYHYAYTYPGINKVLQAAGRLIRTEEDEGIILFVDDRYQTPLYQSLMPDFYYPMRLVRESSVGDEIREFWFPNVK
ncbi:MAG: ATP-dependent DNA helicase [Cellulosilyticaceae bacterium]